MVDSVKASLRLGKLIFFLLLYIHFFGCIWFFIVRQDKTWLPPMDYVWVGTDLYEWTKWDQYWNSQYHSVLMLTGNDVGP